MKANGIHTRIQLLQSLGVQKLNLTYKEIPGIVSPKALEEHLKLYESYKTTLKRVDEKLKSLRKSEIPDASSWDNPFRAIKQAETYALGGIILHDLFFKNITPKKSFYKGLQIEKYIKEQFGSMEHWTACMKGAALEARGWVVFAANDQNNTNDKCRILLLDSHDQGSMFGYNPLILLDVYEHAYFIDHGSDKKSYIDGIFDYLNWQEIDSRLNRHARKL